MSRKNNVNPDHYKVAGRDRPNEDIPPGPVVPDAKRASRSKPAPNHIPGAAPVGEKPKRDDEEDT
jgi:hypothetical protein